MSWEHKPPTELSSSHRRLEKLCSAMGLEYRSEYQVGRYRVDVFLPELYAVIEMDGPYHLRSADALRNRYLQWLCGLKVLHLGTRQPMQKWREALERFIEECADTAQERRSQGIIKA